MVRARERADRRRGAPQRSRRGGAPGSCRRRPLGRGGRGGRRRVADVLHALLLEAAAGAAARARSRRPAGRRARDRLRLPSRHAGAGGRGARAARAGRGDRGRPRARPAGGPPAGAGAQQLLGQPRWDARPLPRSRLADAGLPAARAPGPAGVPRGPCRGGRGRARGVRDGNRRLRDRHIRAHARADGARLLAARIASRRREGGSRDAGASRISSAAPTAPTTSSCAARPAGLRRAAPRGCSAQPARTGRASPSRRRTGRAEPTRRRSRRSSGGSVSTCRTSRPGRSSTRRGEQVGELVTASLTSSLRIAEP